MSLPFLAPYIDGYIDPEGKEVTVVPRVRFPFKSNPVSPDTYSRLYDRDFDIFPGSAPRIHARTAWTNLLTYSQDFENAAWTKTNLSVSANNTTAPDGLVTMDKFLETTTNGEHSVAQAATVTAAAHEVSFFIKGGLTRSWVRAAFTDSAATVFSAFFNASGYVIGASSGTTAKIVSLGNGHFHCALRFTPAAGAGTFKLNLSSDGTTISYAGTTTAGMYWWGAQVALGSVAPYISTLSTTRSILAPDRDPRDPLAYLLAERDPEPINSARSRVVRTFGRIPKVQVKPGTRYIPKPQISGEFPREINGVLVDQPDEETPEYTFYSQVAVTADSGPPAFGITGGDFDLTIGPDTESAIAFDVAAATLQTAINALPLVDSIGTVAVTGAASSFSILFTSVTQPTGDASSLTLSGAGAPACTVSGVVMAGTKFLFTYRFTGSTSFNGGTFTLTIFGQTTAALAFDATRQEIEDAINAVLDLNVTVSIPFTGISYTGNPILAGGLEIRFFVAVDFPAVSVDASGLTPSGSGSITQIYAAGWHLTLSSTSSGTRTITAPTHGIAATDDIVVTVAGVVVNLSAGQFGVPNSNQLTFTSTAGAAFYGGSVTAVGSGNGDRYAADTPQIPIEQTTTYYLCGVSADVEEAADIPIPSRGTPAQLLGAIFGGSTLFNYEVGEIEQWDEFPLISITLTTINPQHLVSPNV